MKDLWKQIYQYVLGALAVALVILALWWLVSNPIPEGNRDVVMVLVGVIASGFTMVLGYFFGSSKGSADKNEIIKNGNGG